MLTPNDIFLSDYSPIKKKGKGYTDEYYKPAFPANTLVFGNMYSIVHFYYCLN
jgi:hypothetical protein